MKIRGGNFFENNVEKLVLAASVLLSGWILFTQVILGSNYVKYEGFQLGPGEIDGFISEHVRELESKLAGRPELPEPYEGRADDYMELLDSSAGGFDAVFPHPADMSSVYAEKREYSVPVTGDVFDVLAAHIRAAAYFPNSQTGDEQSSVMPEAEPNDLDLVTVEAKFDLSRLNERFIECFSGEQLPRKWRNEELASPVFARVELWRQELVSTKEDRWGEWQKVPRLEIYKGESEIFDVPDKIESLPPGGIVRQLHLFNNTNMQRTLLQPKAYQIASANQRWFPPSLYARYREYRERMDEKNKRQKREEQLEEIERRREEMRTKREPANTRRPGGIGGMGSAGGSVSSRTRTSGRRSRDRGSRDRRSSDRDITEEERRELIRETEVTEEDLSAIEEDYDRLLITEDIISDVVSGPLSFWGHDDTVEAGKTYRYRIRLGVFNPIAGKKQCAKGFEGFNDKVILWSSYSEPTEAVEIPPMLYFFPLSIQETTKAITVKVAKYRLGYWYSSNFVVNVGDVIGRQAAVVQEEKKDEEEDSSVTRSEYEDITIPETVDYGTDMVFVDAVEVSDWVGSRHLYERHHFDILYSYDGGSIFRMPVKQRFWSGELQKSFRMIKRSQESTKQPFRDFDSSGRSSRSSRSLQEDDFGR